MSFTSDDTFGEKIRPFSEDFNVAMRGVAADLSNLTTHLPILNELIMRSDVVGAAGASGSFPALIVGEAEVGGGRYLYNVQEVNRLSTLDFNTPPVGEGRVGVALNVAEYTGAQGYRGSGIPQECLNDIQASGSAVQVLSMVGQVVMVSAYESVSPAPPTPDPEEEGNRGVANEDGETAESVVPDFVFHCWVPYCIACGSPDGLLLNQQERRSLDTDNVEQGEETAPPSPRDGSQIAPSARVVNERDPGGY